VTERQGDISPIFNSGFGNGVKPKVAFIGTGGTIASLGATPLDILDYGATGNRMQADAIAAMFPQWADAADVIAVNFDNTPSHNIYFDAWKKLVLLCDKLVAEIPDLAGIVIGHGTASLEETAFFLNLVLKIDLPVVIVGSQRPASALSTDAGMNLINAVRTAASPAARGMGVMVLLNDEIHAAREVTKTSTFRLQTFRTPDFGALGHADGDRIAFYRAPLRQHMPDSEFDIRMLDALPRVDIAYAYVGSDGTAVRAFLAAGARGIVSAGFAPGFPGTADADLLTEAARKDVIVVQSTRAGSGRTFRGKRAAESGFLVADNLNPQKARLLLALALTVTSDPTEITRIFETY
jgi:L-asparaginase